MNVDNDQGYNANQKKYVFRNMYALPNGKAGATGCLKKKIKFILKGN